MAAELFFLPFSTAFTANGLPAGGAKLYFYLSGTLTPADSFTTSDLTTAHPNPVVADGAGRIPAVYLDTSISYRAIIKDRSGVELGDVDPYIPGSGEQNSVTGNAGTATRLAVARTINGVPFDGTAPITVAPDRNVAGIYVDAVDGSDVTALLNGLVAANPGRKLILPRGYFTHTGLNFTSANTVIEGYGKHDTFLQYVGTPLPGGNIRFGPSSPATGAYLSNCGLRKMSLGYGALDTAGTGLRLEQCLNFVLDEVGVNHSLIAIDIIGCSNVFVARVQTFFGSFGSATVPGSMYMRIRAGYNTGGVAARQASYGIFISDCSFVAVGDGVPRVERGIFCQAVDGLYWSGNNYVGQAKYLWDWQVENSSCYIANINITGGLLDGNNAQSTSGMRFLFNAAAPSQAITKIAVSGMTFASFLEFGLSLETGAISALTITGCPIGSCSVAGIDINGATGVSINGNAITGCGTFGNADTGGIRYTSGFSGSAIVGNAFSYTVATARDIVPVSTPAKLQQFGNSTTGDTPVPVINT
ncbi:MAG: hypothetical protein V4696_10265 [Pseudomonadota bacterium]